ncbi:MAG: outer membrane beta-barrel domain-containing protein [Desulfuromonadales bacterium]|nr:outer membrane beta-barrel domain-containing protein [Desulfuromonadales bacterium]
MKTKATLLIAGSLLAMATAASAGNKAQSFSLSPVIGGITFDGKQHLETAPVYGLRAGYNFTKALGIEALFDYSNSEPTAFHGRGNGDVDFYRYGGELLYHFFPDNNFVPYVAAGYAGYNIKGDVPAGANSKTKGVADYGLGAKYFITDNVALRGDVRHLIYNNNDRTLHAIEYTMGLYLPFGGVTPAVAAVEPAPAPVVEPAPAKIVEPIAAPADSDGDGVPDSLDKCPDTPKGVQVDSDGCPLDSDKDGVYDYLDKCPGTPEGVKVDSKGCPLDSDKDGVYDYLDKCPGTPIGVKVDSVGCPLDSDRDGVPDYLDKCPGTPEGVKVDKDGCPEHVAKLCSPTVLDIKFDTNKSNIKPQYQAELKKVGEFLVAFPNAKGVIEGHTDSVGSKASNMKLSQRRADSVRTYIIKTFKIAPERIAAKGYGPTKPVADNKTAAGKQKNRRIEANFSCD